MCHCHTFMTKLSFLRLSPSPESSTSTTQLARRKQVDAKAQTQDSKNVSAQNIQPRSPLHLKSKTNREQ